MYASQGATACPSLRAARGASRFRRALGDRAENGGRTGPPGWRKAFDAVRAALGRVCHDCRPGATAGSLATACEAELERRGFAGSMPHHLGHGIGLESHELPLVTVDSATILEPGMVIAVEPAVVIPDLLGVRIEETLLVTEDGCRIISQPSQEELSPDGVVVV